MIDLNDEIISLICTEVDPKNKDLLMDLFISLTDEESQVIHQAKPHRIIKKISEQIDAALED